MDIINMLLESCFTCELLPTISTLNLEANNQSNLGEMERGGRGGERKEGPEGGEGGERRGGRGHMEILYEELLRAAGVIFQS